MSKLRKVSELTAESFIEYPVWTWAEEDDESLVQPVLKHNPLPEDHDALFVVAQLTLANGRFLSGNVSVRCSDRKVYLVQVNVGTSSVVLPLFNRSGLTEGIRKLAEAVKLSEDQVLPLQYATDFHFSWEAPICGEVSGPD
jgi:hypothetical protein